MKKVFLIGSITISLLFIACNNNKKESGTHTHDDGSTHSDHATDTVKPAQERFKTDTTHGDTSKMHSHDGGKPHSH
jgi:hypothetical protein